MSYSIHLQYQDFPNNNNEDCFTPLDKIMFSKTSIKGNRRCEGIDMFESCIASAQEMSEELLNFYFTSSQDCLNKALKKVISEKNQFNYSLFIEIVKTIRDHDMHPNIESSRKSIMYDECLSYLFSHNGNPIEIIGNAKWSLENVSLEFLRGWAANLRSHDYDKTLLKLRNNNNNSKDGRRGKIKKMDLESRIATVELQILKGVLLWGKSFESSYNNNAENFNEILDEIVDFSGIPFVDLECIFNTEDMAGYINTKIYSHLILKYSAHEIRESQNSMNLLSDLKKRIGYLLKGKTSNMTI